MKEKERKKERKKERWKETKKERGRKRVRVGTEEYHIQLDSGRHVSRTS